MIFIYQVCLSHIWSTIDARQNLSQITRFLLLSLSLSPFSTLFRFLLGSIFSRFYLLFIWFFQLSGGLKVRRHFINVFPRKKSELVETVRASDLVIYKNFVVVVKNESRLIET